MKAQEAYKLLFREYPDVVDVEQMCRMLGGINVKTGSNIFSFIHHRASLYDFVRS